MCFGHLHFEFLTKSMKSSCLGAFVAKPENFFMQNEPNFHQNRANASSCKTKDYKNEPPFLA